MKKLMLFAFVLVASLALILPPLSGTAIAAKSDKNPMPVIATGFPQVVVVSGTNYEMGFQYGEQAAGFIYANKLVINQKLLQAEGTEQLAGDLQVYNYYAQENNPGLVDWMEGISDGCKSKGYDVSYWDVVANATGAYPAMIWSRPTDPYPPDIKIKKIKRPKAGTTNQVSQSENGTDHPDNCDAFAATKTATPDGKPLVTIAAGTTSDVVAHVILLAFPTDGYPFISLPIAGRIANNQGMNTKFAWVMPAAPQIHPQWGLGAGSFHYLSQYCASSAEAIQHLESITRGGTSGNFLFADPTTGDITSFEASAQHSAIRKPGDLDELNFLIEANDFVTASMLQYNYPGYEKSANRYRYWTLWEWLYPVAETSGISLDFVKTAWRTRNWYDFINDVWHYNDPFSTYVPGNAGGQMHEHIYFPAQKTAYIQYGGPGGVYWPAGATGEYTKWQLQDSPDKVAAKAGSDAFSMYTAANALLEQMTIAGKVPFDVRQSLVGALNEAMLAWEHGKYMEGLAYDVVTNGKGKALKQVEALWGETCTDYAKTQLYSQMVTTTLKGLAP